MYLILDADGTLRLAQVQSPGVITVNIEPFSFLGDDVELIAKFQQLDNSFDLASINLELTLLDSSTNDVIYRLSGNLDSNDVGSLFARVDATEEFNDFTVLIPSDLFTLQNALLECDAFNPVNTLSRKTQSFPWPSILPPGNVENIYQILTELDETPTRMSMLLNDNLEVYTQLLRVADKLNIRLIVELDPRFTPAQALDVAEAIGPYDDKVQLIINPNLARPFGAAGIKGRKVPRLASGKLMGWNALRDANTNSQGIPDYQNPIAGFDYPFDFPGMTKRDDFVMDDTNRKLFANAQINVVERMKYRSGIRFILGDVLTSNGDNTSLLKLVNASDIAMYTDNTVNQIVLRHLLKGMDTFVEDATKECKKFLDACTNPKRRLLVESEELGSFYKFSLTPREDRFDAVDVEFGRRPQGAARAAFSNSYISK